MARVKSQSAPFTTAAIAALARPGPISLAICAGVTAASYWRSDPSGSEIVGIIFHPVCRAKGLRDRLSSLVLQQIIVNFHCFLTHFFS